MSSARTVSSAFVSYREYKLWLARPNVLFYFLKKQTNKKQLDLAFYNRMITWKIKDDHYHNHNHNNNKKNNKSCWPAPLA